MARRVSCIPSGDRAFVDAAGAALAGIAGHTEREAIGPMLADLLRTKFPRVYVSPQHDLARFFDDEVWYVYRDGSPGRVPRGRAETGRQRQQARRGRG
jgi:hypothetical protein